MFVSRRVGCSKIGPESSVDSGLERVRLRAGHGGGTAAPTPGTVTAYGACRGPTQGWASTAEKKEVSLSRVADPGATSPTECPQQGKETGQPRPKINTPVAPNRGDSAPRGHWRITSDRGTTGI